MILYHSRAHKRAIRMSKIELAQMLVGEIGLIQLDRRSAFRVARWSKRRPDGFRYKKILPICAYLSEHPSNIMRRSCLKQRKVT